MFSRRTLTISAFITFVSAQSLSQNCTRAVTTIATNSDASACLTPSPLLAIFTSSDDSSVVGSIDSWLTNLCAAPACSNATIAAIVTNVTEGCSAELSGLGVEAVDAAALTTIAQEYYPSVRRAVCFKDGDTNCVTQSLTNVEDIVGPLSISSIVGLIASTESFPTLPTNVTCTNCIKAQYNLVNEEIPGVLLSTDTLEDQCGGEFVDGTNPSGITQSASDDTVDGANERDSGALRGGISKALSGLAAIAGVLVLAA